MTHTGVRSLRSATSCAALAALALACREPAPPPAPAPVRVENAALGLAIAGLPEGFAVEANEGATLRLASAGPGGRGTVTLAVEAAARSVNVIEEAKAAQREIEAKPEATFAGGNELVTPAGAGYAVRGSWVEGGARIEERRIFCLHPDGSGRLVTLVERYPAGDAPNAGERFRRALELLSALEAAPAAQ
jgi:hypothetical protein